MSTNLKTLNDNVLVNLLTESIDYLNHLSNVKGVQKNFDVKYVSVNRTIDIKKNIQKDPSNEVLKKLLKKGYEQTTITVIKLEIWCKTPDDLYMIDSIEYHIYNKQDLLNKHKQQITLSGSLIKEAIATYVGLLDYNRQDSRNLKVDTGLVGVDGKKVEKVVDVEAEKEQKRKDDLYNKIKSGWSVMLLVDDTILGDKGQVFLPKKYDVKHDIIFVEHGSRDIGLKSSNFNLVVTEKANADG